MIRGIAVTLFLLLTFRISGKSSLRILSAARETRGLDRMEQIKRAVLERNGAISIVPRREP